MPSPRASIRYLWAQASIILSCSFNFKDLLVTGGYPYSSDDLTARQEQILDKLRGEMSLLLNDDIVPSELKQSSFGKLFLRNMEVNWSVHIVFFLFSKWLRAVNTLITNFYFSRVINLQRLYIRSFRRPLKRVSIVQSWLTTPFCRPSWRGCAQCYHKITGT